MTRTERRKEERQTSTQNEHTLLVVAHLYPAEEPAATRAQG